MKKFDNTSETGREKKDGTSPSSINLPSIVGMWKDFASETSIHGIKNAAQHSKPKLARALWIVLVLTMSGSLVYTAVDFYLSFTSYPYTTSYTVNRHTSLPFPALTICLKSPFDKTRLLGQPNGDMLMDYVLAMTELNNAFPSTYTSEDLNRTFGDSSFEEIFRNASIGSSDVILWASLGDRRLDVLQAFHVQRSVLENCFTFNRAQQDAAHNVEQKTVNPLETFQVMMMLNASHLLPTITTGIQVYLHDPWDYGYSLKHAIDVPDNMLGRLLISPVKYRFLGSPYLSYGGEDCVDTENPEFKSPLGMNMSYTWRNCVLDSAVKLAVRRCGCVTEATKEWYGSDLPLCNLALRRDCFKHLYSKELTAQQYGDKGNSSRQLCLTQCAFTEYDHNLNLISFPSQSFRNYYLENKDHYSKDFFDAAAFLQLEVNFESALVTVIEHSPALNILDIYSILGGQMGFFLGASLLTLTEVMEALLIMVYTCFRRAAANLVKLN